jgi:hypothetical protein
MAVCCGMVGKQWHDLTVCDKSANLDCAESCYSAVAEELRDAAICDRLKLLGLREDCIQRVQKANPESG